MGLDAFWDKMDPIHVCVNGAWCLLGQKVIVHVGKKGLDDCGVKGTWCKLLLRKELYSCCGKKGVYAYWVIMDLIHVRVIPLLYHS